MNAQDFCYWLHGFTELTRGQTPDPAQWKAIREHLDLVFKKVTPQVESAVDVKIKVDTKDAQKSVGDLAEVMRKYQDALKFHRDWTQQPPLTITC
jgi:hypothetical protein